MCSEVDVMQCVMCDSGEARIVYVSRSYGAGDDLLVIENVPVISCPTCGERYLTAQTLHELEAIKAARRQRAALRPVAVAQFPSTPAALLV
jgi:YgiT-type zinc finger domain-containing protein